MNPQFYLFGLLIVASCPSGVQAQNSSLLQRPYLAPAPAMNLGAVNSPESIDAVPQASSDIHPLQAASWTYTAPQTARVLKLHDIVSIRVDEISQASAQGNASSRKNNIYDARLMDWVQLEGLLTLKPAPMEDGDLRAQGQSNEVYRADSTMRTREQIAFNIAAEVADIRPNGNIVLSAQKTIVHNDNTYEFSLSGMCRSKDIGPDNVILSRDVLDLKIVKNDRGHVRDGYSRGWFTKFLARIKPF